MVPYDTHLKTATLWRCSPRWAAQGPQPGLAQDRKEQRGPEQDPPVVQAGAPEENIATGRALFESELKHAKIPLSSVTAEDVLPSILRKVRFGTLDELYASIGYGGTTAVKSVARINDELLRLGG